MLRHLDLGQQTAVAVPAALVRDEISQRVEDCGGRVGLVGLHDVRVAADNEVGAVPPQKAGQHPLRVVRTAFVLVAPVDADGDAVGAGVPCCGQVARHGRGVNAVDERTGRDGHAVRAVGVVEQGDRDAAAAEQQRVVAPIVGRVAEDARVADAAALQLADGRADTHQSAVAAVVVGQHGDVDPGLVQRIGQRRGRAEDGIARIGLRVGERRLEVHDHEVRGPETGLKRCEDVSVVESAVAACRLDLRQVLHDVAAEEQPDALRRRLLGHADRALPTVGNAAGGREQCGAEYRAQVFHPSGRS